MHKQNLTGSEFASLLAKKMRTKANFDPDVDTTGKDVRVYDSDYLSSLISHFFEDRNAFGVVDITIISYVRTVEKVGKRSVPTISVKFVVNVEDYSRSSVGRMQARKDAPKLSLGELRQQRSETLKFLRDARENQEQHEPS